ncbi:SpoIIE family protein phosphatase [Tuberibacillus sp. Marseille-P3662]|uniref:SpoIIE family protein phosphatase n=1 Tax=Tuberibacillus sp. Marseille-P3662 TaxID=1965358 RepID=UPI000A1C9229|nr:SpoIIE family protein phosphatase [Tuberibacillus sp. Marseille-P3662]
MFEHHYLNSFDIVVFQKAKGDDKICGDSYLVQADDQHVLCAVADGLGSGEWAWEASSQATQTIETYSKESLDSVLGHVNASLLKTRGAVVSVLRIAPETNHFEFCGIGNVNVKIVSPDDSKKVGHPMPNPGFLSGRPVDLKHEQHYFPSEGCFVIYSDGIGLINNTIKDIAKRFEQTSHEVFLSELQALLSSESVSDDMTFIIGQHRPQFF